ncbi:hypothetical protein MLD38_023357 [Melastoma candidum]|uniref:Uncharacterized protein n=1 Tax=Melastoma candidum TaxID=119954 RepID=A0ACB9QM86_9MYRT|nr:hypothetical protein MLD38_023357 [Melastoma candidum]
MWVFCKRVTDRKGKKRSNFSCRECVFLRGEVSSSNLCGSYKEINWLCFQCTATISLHPRAVSSLGGGGGGPALFHTTCDRCVLFGIAFNYGERDCEPAACSYWMELRRSAVVVRADTPSVK